MSIKNKEQRELLRFIKQKKLKIKFYKGWKNFSKNINVPKALVLDVEDIASLQALVREIHAMNTKKSSEKRILVRVANNESYSFTACAASDVVIRLKGKEFTGIKEINDNIVRVGGSMQIGALDKELYEKHKLVLPTSSLITPVSVAGLTANAGHGTGREQPGFAGLIRSITFCLPNGEIVKIDSSHKDFETIRGSHLGLFGIVLDVELECAPAKKMQCVMEVRSMAELIEEIKAGLFLNDPYVSVMYVPTYHSDELTNRSLKNVIVYRWRPVGLENKDVNSHILEDQVFQSLQVNVNNGLGVADLLRRHPSVIPYYTRYLVSRFAVGEKDSLSVGPWYGMHYQTSYPWDIDDADYLFQVNPDCNEIVTALEKIVTTLGEAKEQHQFPVTNAIYLRFLQGTNGGLSTSKHEEGKYVCGLDMVSSTGIAGYAEFKEAMKEYFINGDLQAVPHWGKFVPMDVDYAALYGEEFAQFIRTVEKWHEDNEISLANSMFLNHYLCDVLQLPYKPAPRKELTAKRSALCPLANIKKVANELLPRIEEDGKDAKKFRQRLQEISDTRISSSQSLFKKPKNDKQQQETVKCCVLM